MNNTLLVDSLHISSGGGLILLHYLVDSLLEKNVSFHLLCDARCEDEFGDLHNKTVLQASFFRRWSFYRLHKNDFSAVFCFANIPVPIKLGVPVYTYFHNINLLTLNQTSSRKEFVISWIKRQVFRTLKHNTNFWIVQTTNTRAELIKHLDDNLNKVLIFPFYYLPNKRNESFSNSKGDYLFVGNYYNGAKGHDELLKSWELLHQQGKDYVLHLTIDFSNKDICIRIEDMCHQGIHIINHGTISFSEVVKLYTTSKAIIYPSHNESLGLGIVEAINLGLDVIGADLPYIHAICKPSLTFKPYSAEAIAHAVIEYEKGKTNKSVLLIKNSIDELIKLITEGIIENK